MAIGEVTSWEIVTKDNISPLPSGPDGKRPRRVGLSLQEIMAAIARWRDTLSAPVDSVFGRTGAVVAEQADYDSFFLTPAEGDAAYAAIAHNHTLANITDVSASAAEVNLLDLAGLTVDWVLSADTATTASWKAPSGGGGGLFTEDADDNIIGGTGAGANLTSGSGIRNFLAGIDVGSVITTGDYNVAIGYQALHDATAELTGSDNIAIGRSAMANSVVTTATSNIAIGVNTLKKITTSRDNIIIGLDAGSSITSGIRNIAIGKNALSHASGRITLGDNIAIGASALSGYMTSAGSNIAIGNNALGSLTAGDQNIAIGDLAGEGIGNAEANLLLGWGAGRKITTGDNNIILGTFAGPTSNQTNKLYINNGESDTPLIGGDFAAGTVDINGSLLVTGDIGFYNTAPSAKPTISGSRAGNAALADLLTKLASLGLLTDSTT